MWCRACCCILLLGFLSKCHHPQGGGPSPALFLAISALPCRLFSGQALDFLEKVKAAAWSDPACSQQELSGSSPKRRRAEDKDEGIGSPDIWEDEKAEDLRREMIELRQQLDKERSVRMMLEEQVGALQQRQSPCLRLLWGCCLLMGPQLK